MRIRTTKPEFWRSKTIAALPWDVRFVLKGLESYVDDNGVGKDDIALIAADVFPRDLSANPRETLARLSEAISTLSSAGLIVRYEANGEELIYIDRWKSIQRVDKPNRGRFPRPDGTLEYEQDVDRDSYAKPREGLANPPETLAPVTEEQRNRGTEEQNSPSPADAIEDQPDPFEEFWAHYPRKVEKQDARKAWRAALKKTTASELIDAVKAYPFGDDPRYIKHAATWLNKGCWADEPSNVRSLRPDVVMVNGEPAFTDEQLDEILGPDTESLPMPPPGIDPEIDHRKFQAWLREQKTRRRAERVQQAMALAGQR